MTDIILTFLALIGAGTCGLAVRDMWTAIKEKHLVGPRMRRIEDIKLLEGSWERVGRELEALEAKDREKVK